MLINNKKYSQKGFTLVEMAIIAPIVILVIGTFIYAIINMTGDVMASRAANVLSYNIQDTLTRIESDFKISGGYSQNINPINSPQNLDSDNSILPLSVTTDADTTTSNKPLIMLSYATDTNPLSSSRNIMYANNSPNPCLEGATNISQNTPLTIYTVYFVSSKSLWRRVITNSAIGCTIFNPSSPTSPWQQPSCSPGYNPITSPICKTNDEKLVEGLDITNGFQVTYNTNKITVTINATSNTAGRSIAKSGTISATTINQ